MITVTSMMDLEVWLRWKEALAVDVRPCRPSLKYLQCFISASYRVSVCESVFKSAV